MLSDGIAVAQPDISHAGGISESRRIAAMAETYDVLVAPHCPLGPIALAASLQLDFAIPNFLIQEQALGIAATAAVCWTTSPTARPSPSATATSTARPRPASASPSTRTPSGPPPNAAIAGATRSGATRTAL
jgi:L-alanine-DL-glutamate epimerase-like enolase superfamily enzyme